MEPVTVNPFGKSTELLIYDAVAAFNAYDAVPARPPVNEPVNDPVLTCAEDDTSVGLLTSVLKSPPAEPGAHEAERA
jgi:hypothetical protein